MNIVIFVIIRVIGIRRLRNLVAKMVFDILVVGIGSSNLLQLTARFLCLALLWLANLEYIVISIFWHSKTLLYIKLGGPERPDLTFLTPRVLLLALRCTIGLYSYLISIAYD
uniref:Uncharacterized protein n=1 Tax=Downingia elegans TaxID=104522 RepID=A0A1Z2QTM9_9ASTR|nr:hypothetical protein Do_ele1Pt0789 [Downingia elegans]YP_009403532.1 hypothetical protein Do_ele1Pt1306 [Downingia elegans]ASA34713.1 hypothetical protein Do_ele1Pt0789 [Downingia elegans]ASA34726.1 hypothetical protein Do_ele1Pt1306 [Downingia elegans]